MGETMRILALADTQLGSGRALADDRLADQAAVLDRIADLAHERDVDVVLHCGDVFESRHPGEEERMVFKRWAAKVTAEPKAPDVEGPRRLATTRRLVVVAGNHDLSNTALASAVDLYDRCEFVRVPTVLDLGGCSLACLPWAPIHNLVAAREQARTGAFEQAAEALVAITRNLAEGTKTQPTLLAAHWAFSGSHLPSGMPVDDLGEVVIPSEALRDLGFVAMAGGHIHRGGVFGQLENDARPMLYCGAPYPNSFGETDQEHGVWIIDLFKGSDIYGPQIEFVPLASRPLVTIDCDLTQDSSGEGAASHDAERGLARLHAEGVPERVPPGMRAPNPAGAYPDPTDAIAAAIAEHLPLTDATVRLRYTASEEQARRVDVPALRRLIMDAGAHRISQVEPTIIRSDRARAVVDESMEPGRALAAWCDGEDKGRLEKGMAPLTVAEREGLQGLLARWSG